MLGIREKTRLFFVPVALAAAAVWAGFVWAPGDPATPAGIPSLSPLEQTFTPAIAFTAISVAEPGLPPAFVRDSVGQDPGESHRTAPLPVPKQLPIEFFRVVVTGYTSTGQETDDTPLLTASMTEVQEGCLALSRDLLRTFTPGAPFDCGDYARIPKVGIFLVQDTMHPRWRNRADIWFSDPAGATHWGRRTVWIGRLPQPPEQGIGLFVSSGSIPADAGRLAD